MTVDVLTIQMHGSPSVFIHLSSHRICVESLQMDSSACAKAASSFAGLWDSTFRKNARDYPYVEVAMNKEMPRSEPAVSPFGR